MREKLETRIKELNKEFTTGQAKLQEVETQRLLIQERLLRICGAIQVLEELLAESPTEADQSRESASVVP